MTGPKLNEKSFVAGERSGTKSSALYVHVGAWKAREVLNLIRGLPVREADEMLQFLDREVAITIRKVLASAVANAVHNDEQDAEELFVKACFADEGPTLKRFTPRARGRAGRIKKRTCHITIVVARLDDERLEIIQARFAKRSAAGRRRGTATTTTQSRRARVERSRTRAAGLKDGDTGAATTEIEAPADEVVADEVAAAPEWAGSAAPNADGSAPEGFEIKGNADSMLFHEPGTRYYNQTVAEVYFDSVDSAEAAGFAAPGKGKAAAAEADDADATDADAADEESN